MLVEIDGSNLAHRALHASYSEEGHYSYLKAIPGFLKRLSRYLEDHYLQCGCLVAWDLGLPLFRRELNSEYKPDSLPIGEFSPDLLSKINLDPENVHRKAHGDTKFQEEYQKLVKILSSKIIPMCGCFSIRVRNCEADDIIAQVCRLLPNEEIHIVSSDKDLLQLVNENVSVFSFNSSHKYGNLYDLDWINENYKTGLLDFRDTFLLEKAIVGDTSDNIKGVEGVGGKSAFKYATQIQALKNKFPEIPFPQLLRKVQRPPRAKKIGLENLKTSSELIERNLKTVDLDYPLLNYPSFIDSINKSISMFRYHKVDYHKSLAGLEQIQDLSFDRCYLSFDKIFESNLHYNFKNLLREVS